MDTQQYLLFSAEQMAKLLTPGGETQRLWKDLPLELQTVVLDAHLGGTPTTNEGIQAEAALITIFNKVNPIIVFSNSSRMASINCRVHEHYVYAVREMIQERINGKN